MRENIWFFLMAHTSLSQKPNRRQWEMQKGQQTEDKTCINLGPGRLCAWMKTHQQHPPPVSLLYAVATRGREAFLGEGVMTPWSSRTGGTCDSFSLSINILEKQLYCILPTSAAEAVPIRSTITGHNYIWSLLWSGTVPNSNTQLIQHTCQLPTTFGLLSLANFT
jgi:hypothetical protein